MRIAYEHADSFVTYPQAPNLSAKAEPIRKRLTYPRAAGPSAAATHTRSCAAGPDRWQCVRPAWATTCGVNLRSEGARVSTCPADPAVPVADPAVPVADAAIPVADAAIPVGDGTTPRRSHPSSSHLSAASGAYPSNTTRFITQSRAPTDPLRRPPPDGRRPLFAARCPPPVATRSAVSRPTGRWAASAARKSPAHPQCRRRNAPRAHQEMPR